MFRIIQGRQAARVPRPHSVRGVALALVFAALALLVLKPFCDLAFTAAGNAEIASAAITAIGHGSAGHPGPAAPESVACCASIVDETLINSAESHLPWMPDVLLGAAFIVFGVPLPVKGLRNAARFRLAVPPERSFYLRSARILR